MNLPRRQPDRRAAFTMVEIALCIAIIGFALVAIIGILPIGLKVQRDNREETIINADAKILLESIRNGFTEFPVTVLTNNFDEIEYVDANATARTWTHGYGYPAALQFSNDSMIIGLLSQPYYLLAATNGGPGMTTARVRAFSGAVGDMGGSANARSLNFSYELRTMIIPLRSTNSAADFTVGGNTNAYLATNLSQIVLEFRWPLLPNGRVGSSRKVFRTAIAGVVTNDPARQEFWFFTPGLFLP